MSSIHDIALAKAIGVGGGTTGVTDVKVNGTSVVTDGVANIDTDDLGIAQNVTDWLDQHVDPDTGYVIDDTLSIAGAAADAKVVGDELADVKSALEDSDTIALLHMDEINDTVQTIVFDSVGNVSTITHARGNTVIRTDAFTFAANSITEVRTLNTGETLTIVTNTTTLMTTVTYAAAA